MKCPYYSPNFRLKDLLKALLLSTKSAEEQIKSYFIDLTGKKYILITNSCRTALYLAYRASGSRGEVITSPLTCKVAIDPIVESGNIPVYADVNPSDLNIDPGDIEHRISEKTVAIQIIHLGGVSCNMDRITHIAEKHNLIVIEDCAQSLGAKFQTVNTGSFGLVSCFSLIKNAYGIGGGIFATDSEEIFNSALEINGLFRKHSYYLTLFRIIRNLIETQRNNIFGKIFYKLILGLRRKRKGQKFVINQLHLMPDIAKKITACQIGRFAELHKMRNDIGKMYEQNLCGNLCVNTRQFESSSFTKLFLYNPLFNSKKLLTYLILHGIEGMHLEHKAGSPYQESFVAEELLPFLPNYCLIHSSLISLPVVESFQKQRITYIIEILKKYLDEQH